MTRSTSDNRLDRAVRAGIITEEQSAAIKSLTPVDDEALPGTVHVAALTSLVPRDFTAATIAYGLGAITVVIAMGWFLADRWEWLGPRGVLAVVAIYAALFLLTARVLAREGFMTARGLAVLLAVLLTPIATLALNEITGWFGGSRGLACRSPDFLFWSCRGEEVVAELATAAAALFALRRVRFSMLVLPVAVVALRMLFHLADALGRNGYGSATSGWVWLVGASLAATAAYVTDREQRGDEDFAYWLHGTAAVAALGASITLINSYPVYRHLLVPSAFIAFAAALLMRRRAWVLLGMAWFVWYLGWLASETFRDTPFFPIVLAALGIGVIIATVWVQRNSAQLVKRFGTVSDDGRPRFPGGVPLLLSPILVAALMLPPALDQDRERQVEMEWMNERFRKRMVRERQAAVRAREDALAARQETVSPRRP